MTSEIWQNDCDRKQVLPIGGKKSGLKACQLVAFGVKSAGLTEDRAKDILQEVATSVAARAVEIANAMPAAAARHECCVLNAQRIATIAVENARNLGAPTPEWESVKAPKTALTCVDGQRTMVLKMTPA